MTVIQRIASLKKGLSNGVGYLKNASWMSFCVLFLLSFDAEAQTTDWKWVVGAGGDRLDQAFGVTVDQDDNIYITGNFRDSGVFGDTTLTFEGNNAHLFISKLDKDGNWLWTRGAKSSGAYSRAVEVDDEGNIYIAGYYYQEIVLGDITHIGPRELGFDFFIAKLDKDGNWLWSRSAIGDENLNRQIFDFALDSNGDIYVTGSFAGRLEIGGIVLEHQETGMNFGPRNMFVAKIDSAGQWVWAKMAAHGRERSTDGRGITIDNEDNIYVAGYFQNEIRLDSIILNTGDFRDRTFLARMNSDGEWDWAIHDQGSGKSQALSIDLDEDANVYVTGTFAENSVFGGQEMATTSMMNDQIFAAKADSSGNWLWAEQAGGASRNHGLDVFVSDARNVYLTGFFRGHNSPFGDIMLDDSGAGRTETIFIAKLDEHGDWLWADRAGSPFRDSQGLSVAADRDENIYVTGHTGTNASFGDHELPGFGAASIFLAKMEFSDSKTTPTEYVMELPSGYKLYQNYPNPFNPSTTIEFSLPEAGFATLAIYDILGRQIATLVSGEMKAGKHTYHWDSGGLASGVYLYRLRAGNVSQTRKMQIVK